MDETHHPTEGCGHRPSRARNATYGHCHEPGCPNRADLFATRGGRPLDSQVHGYYPTLYEAQDLAEAELARRGWTRDPAHLGRWRAPDDGRWRVLVLREVHPLRDPERCRAVELRPDRAVDPFEPLLEFGSATSEVR